jgi:hypothetical protein
VLVGRLVAVGIGVLVGRLVAVGIGVLVGRLVAVGASAIGNGNELQLASQRQQITNMGQRRR